MGRPVTLFTGQWADLPRRGARAEGGGLGLRRPRARLLGRPLRGRQGGRRSRLREVRPRAAGAARPRRVGTRRAPRRPGRLRPDRRPAPRHPPAGDLRRRRPRGRPAARGRADGGHGARRRRARRPAGERVHRLLRVAPALLVPAERLRRGRARLPGLRRALGPDPRRVRQRGRALRPRGASHRDRLRLRDDPQGARRGRPASRVRDQPRPVALRPPVPRHGRVRARVRRPRSTTST